MKMKMFAALSVLLLAGLVLGCSPKVVVENNRKNKGRVIIEYYSLDDLDRILGVIRK